MYSYEIIKKKHGENCKIIKGMNGWVGATERQKGATQVLADSMKWMIRSMF